MTKSNRLASETSPYLLQHAQNPVDWYPWGDEAFARAVREDKPVLLSVGYSACHWCHVMERESFENSEIAQLMNELFVSIKVDREERPDIDSIYMKAVQALTGQGGWPMTVFLTPRGFPFYGGTYYPPEDRHGLPAFPRVLRAVSDAYHNRRSEVEAGAGRLREIYDVAHIRMQPSGKLEQSLLDGAFRDLSQSFDARHGGFGGAPKFPQTMVLDFLLRYWRRTGNADALEMVATTLRKMSSGGIYDQIGGGFARYSTDAQWLVPHFEKMLYDNALLLRLAASVWQATGDVEARIVAEETAGWVAREMTSQGGGFYSALDADSEGEEGRFYLWTEDELHELLGADTARLVGDYFGVSKTGNFEGRNILHVPDDDRTVAARLGIETNSLRATLVAAREKMYEARATRTWPARDEKIIASWNGLMMRALAEAARALGDPELAALATRSGEFVFEELVRDSRVFRVHISGMTRIPGMLEDHAAVALGALALYEMTFDRSWIERARSLTYSMLDWFWDEEVNAFFDTAHDHDSLIARPRELMDNPTPSGNSLATELLLRMSQLLDDAELAGRASSVLETLASAMERYPSAFGHLLGAADLAINGTVQVAICGNAGDDDFAALAREAAKHYLPALVLAGGSAGDTDGIALLAGREAIDGRATAYVCRDFVCDLPVTAPGDLSEQIERAMPGRVAV